ncbi:MAG: SAM-dependent methyltransferase [Ignisphaera sp.]
MVLYIVGVGPGDPEYITIKALKAIAKCVTVAAWRKILEQFRWLIERKEVIEIDSRRVHEFVESIVKRAYSEDVCLLLRGDPFVSERNLMNTVVSFCRMYRVDHIIISGVSSVNLVLAKLHIDLGNTVVLSLHSSKNIEEDLASIEDILRLNRYLIIYPRTNFVDVIAMVKKISEKMVCDSTVYMFQRLSFSEENVVKFKLSEMLSMDRDLDAYTILVIEPCTEVY